MPTVTATIMVEKVSSTPPTPPNLSFVTRRKGEHIIVAWNTLNGVLEMECEVCGGNVVSIQSREEEDPKQPDFTRWVIYRKCDTCGMGAIFYHPYAPK